MRDALADNFNTPKALSAIMNLVHVCNIELCRTSANVKVSVYYNELGLPSLVLIL